VRCSVLRPDALNDGAKQIRFPHKLVEQPSPLDQLRRCIEFGNLAVIKYHDPVGIEDGVDAMSNGDNGSVLEHVAAQCHLEHGVRFNVNGGLEDSVSEHARLQQGRTHGGFIQDKDIARSKQCACQGDKLSLSLA
jgi:hypothetical protein